MVLPYGALARLAGPSGLSAVAWLWRICWFSYGSQTGAVQSWLAILKHVCLATMAPPTKKKERKKYETHLEKQRLRRAKIRNELLKKKFQKTLPVQVRKLADLLKKGKETHKELKEENKELKEGHDAFLVLAMLDSCFC